MPNGLVARSICTILIQPALKFRKGRRLGRSAMPQISNELLAKANNGFQILMQSHSCGLEAAHATLLSW